MYSMKDASNNLVPKKRDDALLYRSMPESVRRLQAQARKELRSKQRAIFKGKYLSQ